MPVPGRTHTSYRPAVGEGQGLNAWYVEPAALMALGDAKVTRAGSEQNDIARSGTAQEKISLFGLARSGSGRFRLPHVSVELSSSHWMIWKHLRYDPPL